MTSKYEEFIGKQPSLNELGDFIEINKEAFEEYNNECKKDNHKEDVIDVSVVYTYLQFAKDYGGHYYVGGYIKKYPNDPIEEKCIAKARKMNNESDPMHMAEVASKIRSSKELNNLGKILEVYYEKYLEVYYAPPNPMEISGGEGYQKVAKETLIGK
jgi:hypothetical protein